MIITGLWLLLLKNDTSASFQPSLHQLLRYRRAERAFQLSCLCIIKADTILQYNAQTYYSTSLLSDSLLIIEFVILKVRSCPCRIKAHLSSQHRYSLKTSYSQTVLSFTVPLCSNTVVCTLYKVKYSGGCSAPIRHGFLA